MSEQVWIVLIVAGAIVVLVALKYGRRISVKYGKGTLETSEAQRAARSMSMTASGLGSRLGDAEQVSRGGDRNLDMKAEHGGVIERVKQDDSSSS